MGRIMGQTVHIQSRHLVAFQQFFVQMYVREPSQGLVTPVQLRSSSPDFLTAPLPSAMWSQVPRREEPRGISSLHPLQISRQ